PAGFARDGGHIDGGGAGALGSVLVLDDVVGVPAKRFDALRKRDVRIVLVGDGGACGGVWKGVPEGEVQRSHAGYLSQHGYAGSDRFSRVGGVGRKGRNGRPSR